MWVASIRRSCGSSAGLPDGAAAGWRDFGSGEDCLGFIYSFRQKLPPRTQRSVALVTPHTGERFGRHYHPPVCRGSGARARLGRDAFGPGCRRAGFPTGAGCSVPAPPWGVALMQGQPSEPRRSLHAFSQRRQASAQSRQCSCRPACCSHSLAQALQVVAQACSTVRVTLAS